MADYYSFCFIMGYSWTTYSWIFGLTMIVVAIADDFPVYPVGCYCAFRPTNQPSMLGLVNSCKGHGLHTGTTVTGYKYKGWVWLAERWKGTG